MVYRRVKINFNYFHYALENSSETCTTDRTYKLWQESNKTKRLYIDGNNLADVRRDVMQKKRLTDTELQRIKSYAKKIIKKMKEKVAVTEQPDSESKDE